MLVQGEYVARWVMEKVGSYTEGMTALGWEIDGVIVAGTAFENWNIEYIEVHKTVDPEHCPRP